MRLERLNVNGVRPPHCIQEYNIDTPFFLIVCEINPELMKISENQNHL